MNDNIFRKPYIWLAAGFLSPALLLVFNTGDLDIPLLLSLMLFLSVFITWLVMLIRALFLRRFRYFGLILFFGIFTISAGFLCLRFSDEIHFQVMRPFYLWQINSASKEVTDKDWDWGETGNAEKDLLYIRNVTPTTLSYEKGDPNYNPILKKMSAHFFVLYTSWD